jgi:hypothetical protein
MIIHNIKHESVFVYFYLFLWDRYFILRYIHISIFFISLLHVSYLTFLLQFLGQGLPCLLDLNVAKNEVTSLHEEELFKCVNLQTLNLSGNPLFTVQDVQAVKVLSNLQNLYLADPVYGKCPVAALCDSRSMLLSILTNISNLDGKCVSLSELSTIQVWRRLFRRLD